MGTMACIPICHFHLILSIFQSLKMDCYTPPHFLPHPTLFRIWWFNFTRWGSISKCLKITEEKISKVPMWYRLKTIDTQVKQFGEKRWIVSLVFRRLYWLIWVSVESFLLYLTLVVLLTSIWLFSLHVGCLSIVVSLQSRKLLGSVGVACGY